jgi:PAS domain-containing protein/CheY-like chemotaxis protein
MKDQGKRKSALLREVEQLRKRLAAMQSGQNALFRAERALGQYWSVLDAILSGTRDLYAIKGTNYTYQAANRAFCRFVNLPEHEIRGRGDFEIFPGRLAEIFHQEDVRVLQSITPVLFETLVPVAEDPRWFRFHKRPVLDREGRCAGILCVIQDTSDVARYREQQKILIGSADRGFWCTDVHDFILDVNSSYLLHSGYQREELIGKNVREIEMMGSPEAHAAINARILKLGSGNYHTIHRAKNNQILEFDAEAVYLPEHGGRFYRYFRLGVEAPTFSMQPSPDAPSSITDTRTAPHRRVLNLNDLLVAALNQEIDQVPPGISIRKVLDPALRNTLANSAQISQVILNITTNAIEAMEGRGHLTYTTRNVELTREWLSDNPELKPGHYVYLSITDTGRGIPTTLAAKIFEPFITTKFKGRGMGLASVARNIEEHHGLVTVKSEVDKGSTFTVYLPATDAPMESRSTTPQIPSGTETILFIDPESRVLDEARRILERLAYTVVLAGHVEEAIHCIAQRVPPVDAVVVDTEATQAYDGDLITDLRAANPKVKIILAGTADLDEWAQDLLDAGANAYVKKPFRPEVLAPKIRRTLDT